MPKSLRSFIEQIDHQHPEDLAVVKRTVDPNNYDVSAVLEHLTQRKQFPMVLFDSTLNLKGQPSGMRIVSNVFGTRELIADALGFPREKAGMSLALEYARLERAQIPWRGVRAAAVWTSWWSPPACSPAGTRRRSTWRPAHRS